MIGKKQCQYQVTNSGKNCNNIEFKNILAAMMVRRGERMERYGICYVHKLSNNHIAHGVHNSRTYYNEKPRPSSVRVIM